MFSDLDKKYFGCIIDRKKFVICAGKNFHGEIGAPINIFTPQALQFPFFSVIIEQ